jgi:hypothetical protein
MLDAEAGCAMQKPFGHQRFASGILHQAFGILFIGQPTGR